MINLGRNIRTLGLLLVLLVASTCVQAQQQRVEVELNANRVSVDESVIFNVRAYGLDAEIITSALEADFDVTQRSSSRQLTIENGKRTSLVEWVFELAPKRTGALEVPPVMVGTELSRPLTLLVEPPADGVARDMYLEASVDISDPYVQAQVIYTLRVFQDVQFLEATLQVPEVDGLTMQQISEEKTYQETVEGRTYVVSEIRYSVFPKQSGPVSIPTIELHAVVAAHQNLVPNTRTRTRRIKRRANEIELNVKARPDGMAGSWWLPAKAVNVRSEWSSPIDAMVVDQPVTRTIQILATGVGDKQIPEIDVPTINNVSVYADKPTTATKTSEQGLVSEQTNTWAVIPQAAGELVLPEVIVNWFDTTTGEARVAVLPAETITVVDPGATPQASDDSDASANVENNASSDQIGQTNNTDNIDASIGDTDAMAENTADAPITNTDTASQEPNTEATALSDALTTQALQSVRWLRGVVVALVAGWLLSLLGLWLWMRKRHVVGAGLPDAELASESGTMRFKRRAGSRAALDSIKVACESADASKISNEVLSWAAMVWPERAPTHISAVAQRLNSADLAQAFDAIDAQQYRPSGSVNSVAVEQIPALLKKAVDLYQEVGPDASETSALPNL